MRKVFFALILSVFIHLLLATGVSIFPVSASRENRQTVEIEIRDQNPASRSETDRQIVRETLVPDKMKAPENEDPAQFLSAQRQRVTKETRAAEIGRTANRSNSRTPEARDAAGSSGRRNLLTRDDLLAAAAEATRGTSTRSSASSGSSSRQQVPSLSSPGTSTIGESLPDDMQIGSFTALNTDRYLYYSFFARVEDLIRFRWETGVQNAIQSTPPERMAGNVRARWITQMEVLIHPSGEFEKVVIMKQSGLPAFDRAAAQAFADARFFPNPPVEMTEDDGLIHLKYSFTVHYEPRLLARPE